jgi:hypothetical protein
MKQKPRTKPQIGDLWLVKKLPPLLFVYTEYGWIVHEGGLLRLLWIVENAKKRNRPLIEADKPPRGAKRWS